MIPVVEKRKIIETLVSEICKSDLRCIMLGSVRSILNDANISNSNYPNGPKQMLQNEFFNDFYVGGTNGKEVVYYIGASHPEARTNAAIGAILTDLLQKEKTVLFARIPGMLKDKYKINYQEYSDGLGLETWLINSFDCFEKDNLSLRLREESSKKVPVHEIDAEIQQMYSVVYMYYWNNNLKKIRQFGNFSGYNEESIRKIIALNLAKGLLGLSDSFIDESDSQEPKFAFDTGLRADNGKPIYCIAEKNPHAEGKQYWHLLDFCCPGDVSENGLGNWLGAHITQNRYSSIKYAELQKQIEEIEGNISIIVPSVQSWIEHLQSGRIPADFIATAIADFEHKCKAFQLSLSGLPIEKSEGCFNLQEMKELFDEKNTVIVLLQQAIDLFDVITEQAENFFENALRCEKSCLTSLKDREYIHNIYMPVSEQADIQPFREMLKYYKDLLTVMSSHSLNENETVPEALDSVLDHFTEIPWKLAARLLINQTEDDYKFLNDVNRVYDLLEQYSAMAEMESSSEEIESININADEILNIICEDINQLKNSWISYLHNVLPEDRKLRSIVFAQADEHESLSSNKELTPYGAGLRLYENVGNQDRLAETYFLLGLLNDKNNCVSALLRIYRESDDSDKFKKIWTQFNGQNATEEDTVYWLTHVCAEMDSDVNTWDVLQNILKGHPDLIKKAETRDMILQTIAKNSYIPNSFKEWLNSSNMTSNKFEVALAENDIDLIYSILDDKSQMLELGYSEEAIAEIKNNLTNNIPGGMNDFSKGQRIFAVQGNINRSAEKYYWAASADKQAVFCLFDIYFEEQDYQSVLWIVNNFSVNFNETNNRLRKYTLCLTKCNDTKTLAEIAEKYPEIWYYEDVLNLLAFAENTDADGTDVWKELLQQYQENPFVEPCEFEEALVIGDRVKMREMLLNNEQMREWGYSEELQQKISDSLERYPFAFDGNVSDIARRIFEFQGNLHRFYESFLYQALNESRIFILPQIFSLMVAEKRYLEVVAYYDAYSVISSNESNTIAYLWGLVYLEKYSSLLEVVNKKAKFLLKDEQLTQRVFEIAEQLEKYDYLENIRRVLNLTAHNQFEMSLINLNLETVQEFISNPNKLLEMGYSWEEINHFKACISRPIPRSNDGYTKGCRMRTFFGDVRSEQFFLESEDDTRSARTLFDIYNKANRWDDLCNMYRRHNQSEVWNSHYYKHYVNALTKTKNPENCLALVNIISENAELEFDKNSIETQWIYLKALFGARKLSEVKAQELVVLQENSLFRPELALPYLDLLWSTNSLEMKEHAVYFAAEIINLNKDFLTFDGMKLLASVNGNLINDEKQDYWLRYLSRNKLTNMSRILNCCFGFEINNDPDKLGTVYSEYLKELKMHGNKKLFNQSMLLYFEFVKNADLSEAQYVEFVDNLLVVIFNLFEQSYEEVNEDNWNSIIRHCSDISFAVNQFESLLVKMTRFMDNSESVVLKIPVIQFAIQIFTKAHDLCVEDNNAYAMLKDQLEAMCDIIVDAWIKLFDDYGKDLDYNEWKIFISFIENSILNESQLHRIAKAWLESLDDIENKNSDFFARGAYLLEKLNSTVQTEQIINIFTTFISNSDQIFDSQAFDIIVNFLAKTNFSYEQMNKVIDVLISKEVFENNELNDLILNRCDEQWPELSYLWLKSACVFFTNNSEQTNRLYPMLLERAYLIDTQEICDSVDIQLLYDATCENLSQKSLGMLREVYEKAGKTDQANILSVIEQSVSLNDSGFLMNWFLTALEENDIDWIERYFKWWTSLIRLTEEDIQTKNVLTYLGLNDEPVSDQIKMSVTRLLLSDIYNTTCLKCYLRIVSDLSPAVKSKLEYLVAVTDDEQMETVIQSCCSRNQYDLSIRLLMQKMKKPITNSATLGQLLGELFTEANIVATPLLSEIVPDVYLWIKRMNIDDPKGAWKNIGRAVDIAVLTQSESVLFKTFEENIFREYPAKCAVIIANLVLRTEFAEAKYWIDKALISSNHNNYLTLLKDVLGECMNTEILSQKNELLVRSIPKDGNQRSLEFYGEFVLNALEQGLQEECMQVFEYLYDTECTDKAFVACYIHLFSAQELNDSKIIRLYKVLKNYFNIAQDAYALRIAKSLAVVHNCLPDCPEKQENIKDYCLYRLDDEAILKIVEVETNCREFISNESEYEQRRRLLISAATGWWKIDNFVFKMFNEWKSLAKTLVGIYPVDFSSACVSAALNNKDNNEYIDSIVVMLKACSLGRCAKHIYRAKDIKSYERAAMISTWFSLPIEAPGVYPCLFKKILKNNVADQVEDELTLYFSIQPNFTYFLYRDNMYHMKEFVETEYPEYRISVLRVMTHMGTDSSETTENLAMPSAYLDVHDYLMVVNAAEQRKTDDEKDYYFNNLNETYILLGKLITGQLDKTELSQIKLHDFMNMANVLCQSASYADLDEILKLCPAKWKICVRCVQELIQGRPSNILMVMKDDTFWSHDGCASFVERLAREFISKDTKKGQNLLLQENKKEKRPNDWGVINESDIREPKFKNRAPIFFLKIGKRNPAKIKPFRKEISEYLEELRKDDEQRLLQKQILLQKKSEESEENKDNSSGNNLAVKHLENRDYRNIPYVIKESERWIFDLPTESDEIDKLKNKLKETDYEALSEEERVDYLGKLIALDMNNPNDYDVRWNCVRLGLLLFEMNCERKGLASFATSQARSILYDMTACDLSDFRNQGIGDKIRTYIQWCLISYDDLSVLVSDCSQDKLIDLCKIIDDKDVSRSFLSHIKLIRNIGSMMGQTMTNQERLDELTNYIHICHKQQTSIDSALKQALSVLLNQQVADFRNNANIIITVYNEKGTQEEGYIFGKIQNLGRREVYNVQLDLSINDVFAQSYALEKLDGESMIPFDFKYYCDEDAEELRYSLVAKYNVSDDKTEQTRVYEGTLRLSDADFNMYRYTTYQTDSPVSENRYIERTNLQKILVAYYGQNRSFDNFPNLAIYGMKRTGKSSVLRRLKRLLNDEHGEQIYVVDSSGEGASGNLTKRVHSLLINQILNGRMNQDGLCNIFASEPEWNEFYDKWKNDPQDASDFDWIEEFYSDLSRKFLKEKSLVVIVDEIENLYRNDSEEKADMLVGENSEQTNIWGVLSRITQSENSKVRFVLCGSDFFTNKILEGDNLTQFFQRIKKLSVGRMEFNEIEEAIRQIEHKDSDIIVHKDAVQYLWMVCGGLPWHSKLICNTIIENRLIPENRNVIYPADILWGAEKILNTDSHSSDNNYGMVALSDDERICVSILTEESKTVSMQIGENTIFEQFSKRVDSNDARSRFDRAMRTLLSERQMIKRNIVNGEPHYQFGCELYRLYNRKQKILNQFFKR